MGLLDGRFISHPSRFYRVIIRVEEQPDEIKDLHDADETASHEETKYAAHRRWKENTIR